ncbi:MAG: hypothetical protein E6Q97_06835 [Desulfurellales bacterium]|nr:MAG: hypothetical protein E6Q97_06835 [Desulfurellales bacterium]
MATIKYKWQPGTGEAVEVLLFGTGLTYRVLLSRDTLGFVEYHQLYGWRWQRAGHAEQRGSRLATRDCAVSALMFALRQEGKV